MHAQGVKQSVVSLSLSLSARKNRCQSVCSVYTLSLFLSNYPQGAHVCVCACVQKDYMPWEPQGKPIYETIVTLSTLACVTVSSHTTTTVVYVRSLILRNA